MIRDSYDLFESPDRGRFGENDCGNDSIRDERITLTLQLRQDRPLAIMVSDPAHGAQAKWLSLPKSLIDYQTNGALVTVTLPESLAIEKGLV